MKIALSHLILVLLLLLIKCTGLENTDAQIRCGGVVPSSDSQFELKKNQKAAIQSRSRVERHARPQSPELGQSEDDNPEIETELVTQNNVQNGDSKSLLEAKLGSNNGNTDDNLELPEGYSVYEIPKDRLGSPLPLRINIHVNTILDVDELEEVIQLDLELKVLWTDYKILEHYQNISVDPKSNHTPITVNSLTPAEIKKRQKVLNNPFILEKIWKPNLFIENLLSVRQPAVMARPLTIKLIPELGWVDYITRISVKLDCEMKFHYYPADTQFCDFSIRGFSYNHENLRLKWFRNGAYLDDLELPSFDVQIESIHKLNWAKKTDPEEIFDVLTFRVAARRRLSYHLVQTYLASTFYIIITCLCFLLPSKMVEARIGISMTTLLTLTAMFASVRESTPIVSYVKAIDVWMVGCIFFVFLTLSQFTFYIWLRTAKEEYLEQRKQKEEHKNGLNGISPSRMDNFEIEDTNGQNCQHFNRNSQEINNKLFKKFQMYEKIATLIDKFSFLLFLFIFAVYTTIYWSWLLIQSDYFHWAVNKTLNNVDGD